MLLSVVVMTSCVHYIQEQDKGIIIGIDKCSTSNEYIYKVTIKDLDKCALTCLMTYYTNTEYRIGDTVALCVTPQQNNINDTTKIN